VSAVPPLSLSVVPDRDHVTIAAVGEIDLATAGDIETQLQELWESGWVAVDIDLRQVTFMDSSGLHMMVRATRAAHRMGRSLTIIDGSDQVRRLLELTSMEEVLPIKPRTTGGPSVRAGRRNDSAAAAS
jgi:anti-anti-sigma factor